MNSSAFTGILELTSVQGMEHTAPWLLDLPNDLRFRKFKLPWVQWDDLEGINTLVAEFLDTLDALVAFLAQYLGFCDITSALPLFSGNPRHLD